jgi:SOS response regulatory protein OraA/RecX
MKILLYAVNPIAGGEETELCFEISDGENIEKKKLIITSEMFFELGFPHFPCGKVEVSCGKLDEIEYLAKKTAAIKRGIYILSFADNTKKSLARKLVLKGFSKEIALDAADHLEKVGYINEIESAKALSRDLAEKKLYGIRRISSSLYEKGFSRDAIEAAIDEIDVDFHIICGKRIEAMGGSSLFSDKDKKQKAIASLMRYGFSYDDIREGLKLLKKRP